MQDSDTDDTDINTHMHGPRSTACATDVSDWWIIQRAIVITRWQDVAQFCGAVVAVRNLDKVNFNRIWPVSRA